MVDPEIVDSINKKLQTKTNLEIASELQKRIKSKRFIILVSMVSVFIIPILYKSFFMIATVIMMIVLCYLSYIMVKEIREEDYLVKEYGLMVRRGLL
jgi:hypothetical protein